MPTAPDTVTMALTGVMRTDRGRIMSALVARTGDFQLAEDAVSDAVEAAIIHWGRSDIPGNPLAWLIRVAFRKAIDRLRRKTRDARQIAAMAILAQDEAAEDPELIADERLRLIFTCCHPALDPKSRVALTLRTIAGLSTAEIARAFLDSEPTMGQRLSRARTRLAEAGIPFAVPGPQDWADRLQSVLAVIYLIFNVGYSAGPAEPRDLAEEAIYLARMLDQLRPGEAEVEGVLALMLITDARRAARRDRDGATVALADQDRTLWSNAAIAEGVALRLRALDRAAPGPYQIKAAIASCQVQADGPDWPQIAALYARLLQVEPTPVVALNHAVAIAETGQLHQALAIFRSLADGLPTYQPFHAACAEYLGRAGRIDQAVAAYDRAIDLALTSADAAFLIKRRDTLLK